MGSHRLDLAREALSVRHAPSIAYWALGNLPPPLNGFNTSPVSSVWGVFNQATAPTSAIVYVEMQV